MMKYIQKLFIIVFCLILALPLLFANRVPETISKPENRTLASYPLLYIKDKEGNYIPNENYLNEFNSWFEDNIGFRSEIVKINAVIKYKIFHTIADGSKMYLGPNGILDYISEEVIENYTCTDVRTKDKLAEAVDAYQTVSEYLANRDIQFYFVQCYDKQSIYPEYFPSSILQQGNISRADQLVEALKSQTDVEVIALKDIFLEEKATKDVYGTWTDPSHWNQIGAKTDYREIMRVINSYNEEKLRVLDDEDYNISYADQGMTLFDIVHEEDYTNFYVLKEDHAKENKKRFSEKYSHHPNNFYFENDSTGNDLCILLLDDSYIRTFILRDFAQSFRTTLNINRDYVANGNFISMIDTFEPDIVIYEQTERSDGTDDVIEAAFEIKNSIIDISRDEWEDGHIDKETGENITFKDVVRTEYFPSTSDSPYMISNRHYGDTNNYFQVYCYDADKNYLGALTATLVERNDHLEIEAFRTLNDTAYVRFAVSLATLGKNSSQRVYR